MNYGLWEAKGMTLSDYFAAQAMAAYIARNTAGQWDDVEIARMSIIMARAMIIECSKEH